MLTVNWMIDNTIPVQPVPFNPFEDENHYRFYLRRATGDADKFDALKTGTCDYDIRQRVLSEWGCTCWFESWFNAWHWNIRAHKCFFHSSVADYLKSLSYQQRRTVAEMLFENSPRVRFIEWE